MNRRTMRQPPEGSVVLAHGEEGTAWQRLHTDGRWHSTTGKTMTWDELQDATLDVSGAGVQYPRLWAIHRTEAFYGTEETP